jgi:hypothetical protein
MRIDVRDLLHSVPGIRAPGTRVGLPDGPTVVEVAHPDRFAASLDAAMRAFRELRPGTQTLVSADVNSYRKEVWIRVLQNGRSDRDRNGGVEESLAPSLDSLRAVAERSRGGVHYWGGNNYLDVSLPYPNPDREDFLEVKQLSWNERYRVQLERESWESLQHMVFRFSNLAATLADLCLARGMATVLVPSVGICVHPWLFASRGLTVTATDVAGTALAALSEPGCHPNLYSSAAYERWDTSTCASFAMIPHPDHFDGMPALEDDCVREALRHRIAFVVADWARLPVPAGTIDLVFATNAIPRDSGAERVAVLEEWVRVLRPGGVAYIAQHHAGGDWGVESFFRERGFVEGDFFGGEQPHEGVRGGFQIRYSSG